MFETLMITIFILGYVAIALEHAIGINKAATALLTAVACWVVMVIRESQIVGGSIDNVLSHFGHHLQGTAEIIFFLVGAMTIVQLMEVHGGFQIIVNLIKTRHKVPLLWIVAFITFFLSAVLGLIPTAIVMVAMLSKLLKEREDRLVFASMIVIAANAGGAWSPIGDVTTTMLWIGDRVSAFGLIGRVIVPSLVSMLVPLIIFSLTIKKGDIDLPAAESGGLQVGARRVFVLGLGALLLVPVFKVVTGLPPVIGVLFGLGMLWMLTDRMHLSERQHLQVPNVMGKIDLSSVMFFLGILLAVAALDAAGILTGMAGWLDRVFGNLDIIATGLGLLSAIVDNVPLTAAVMGMYSLAQFPTDSKLWELLAFTVGTGGSILIIGSAAGVVVMGMEKIDFFWYLRRVSLPALLGYFAGVGAYLVVYSLMH